MSAIGLLILLLVAPIVHATESTIQMTGVCPPDTSEYVDGGAWPAAATISPVRVVLGLRDRAGLDALVVAQQDPRSPEYRRWRDVAELADRFGPRRARYQRVRRWLQQQGLQVVADSPLRVAITVAGTTAQIEAAFAPELRTLLHDGRRARSPRREPRIPRRLAADISGIIGLDTLPTVRPVVRFSDGSFGMAPRDWALAYEVGELTARGRTGAGTTIGVVARSDFDLDDVRTFRDQFLPGATGAVRKRFPSSNPGVLKSKGNIEALEVLLDTQWAGAVAPGAAIETVIGSKGGDVLEALQHLVEVGTADVITFSFSLCERDTPRGYAATIDALFTLANAQGQTVVVAAGDNGDQDCPKSHRRAVNVLAASSHVVAIGGSTLTVDTDPDGNATSVVSETVWNDLSGAGGGGESAVFALPSFQQQAGLLGLGRLLPDLAVAASGQTSAYVVVQGNRIGTVGGTSASAPAFAGLLGLAVEQAGSRLGNVLPSIYALAQQQPAVFRDIVSGSNGFDATPGFDQASGWGSPRGTALVDAVSGATAARCAPLLDCLVPGAGPEASQCGVQWRLDVDQPQRARARTGYPLAAPRRTQRCQDGDPSCDLDGRADGQCTFSLGFCLNVIDSRTANAHHRPRCLPQVVTGLSVVAPRPGPAGLTAMVAGIALPTQRAGLCSDVTPVTVPTATRPTRFVLRARRSSGISTARLRMQCTAAQ